jgi:hypothetical protein
MKINKYRFFLAFGFSFLLLQSLWAQEGSTAAPNVKTFALNPDQIGSATNSVNLYTGDVNLPVNLVSLPGHNGLDVQVSMAYTSNVQQTVNTWNLDAPTGILGLGWSMDFPKIVVDHKQTGVSEDDDYYLMADGTANKLLIQAYSTDANGAYTLFVTKEYRFWNIRKYNNAEKWVITKEDGTKYVYGGLNDGRNAVQWIVRWDNWIGNSNRISLNDQQVQQQLAHAWNLSEISNLWGDKITFEYKNEEQPVGSEFDILGRLKVGQKQTEASYLKCITDASRHKIEFFYQRKSYYDETRGETDLYYQEPHTEKFGEPDAYQEFYEKEFLEHIEVKQQALMGYAPLFSIHFQYSSVNSFTYTAKPLLTSVIQKNAHGEALPGLTFDYYRDGVLKGFLQKVTLPTKGTISYTYKTDNNAIGHSDRQLSTITAPSGYAEPKVWIEEDYVVIAWRELNSNGTHSTGGKRVKVVVYQWVGEWQEKQVLDIYGVGIAKFTNSLNYTVEDYKDFQVVLEKNFFAILSRASTGIHDCYIVYKDEYNQANWLTYKNSIEPAHSQATLLSGEKFVAVGINENRNQPVELRGYIYQGISEGDDWNIQAQNRPAGLYWYTASGNYILSHNSSSNPNTISFSFVSEYGGLASPSADIPTLNSDNSNDYWHSTNAFAVGMISDHPEYIYRWNSNFSAFSKEDVLGRLPDGSSVFMLNNSLIGINEELARFDGVQWHTTHADVTVNGVGQYMAYGDDMVIRPTQYLGGAYKGSRREFNPNTLLWESDVDMESTSAGGNFSRAGLNYHYFGNDCYYRYPNGLWYKIFSIPGSPDKLSWYQGNRFDVHSPSNSYSVIYGIKNGALLGPFTLYGSRLHQWQSGTNSITYFPRSNFAGGKTIVSVPNTGSYTVSNIKWLQLNRFVGDQIAGKQVDYPVITITTDDGQQKVYTTYDYDFQTATVDPSGMVAQYHKVKVIPGSAIASSTPAGYSEIYFYNGLLHPGEESMIHIPQIIWNGLPYITYSYNSSGIEVSKSTTFYHTFSKNIGDISSRHIDVGYYVRTSANILLKDDVETISLYEYDEKTGLVSYSTSSINTSQRVSNRTRVDYTYFWQKYDPNRERNILSPVVQTKKTIYKGMSLDGKVVEVGATTWKQWNTVWSPYKSYRWLRTGSTNFDFANWSEASEPASDWKKVSQIDQMDTKGNVLETTTY